MRRLIAVFGLVGLAGLAPASGCSSSPSQAEDDVGGGGSTNATSSGDGGSDCAASELCNGSDDDCDGEVDEGCACVAGEVQSCYSGPPELENIGVCQAGEQVCDDTGTWGECAGEGLPGDEICDGLDNDCNGSVDEGFGSVTCGLGTCQVTIDECVDGVPQACIPGRGGDVEICNGIDDTCDGNVDEGCDCENGDTQSCYSGAPNTLGVGLCTAGTQLCEGGAWGICDGAVTPVTEACDGLDNDCDGTEDDGNPEGGGGCLTPLPGVCKGGHEQCIDGDIECVADIMPGELPEVCNNLDDDCMNGVDDGDPGGGATCDTGLDGVCGPGVEHCVNGDVTCQQITQASPEICDGLDNDCMNGVDDGDPGGGGTCDTGNDGICAVGTEVCGPNGVECVQNQQPLANEICGNDADDTCDGEVDEGCGCSVNNDCDGNAANGCECPGTGCCNTSCQTQHDTGQGLFFYDCEPLATYDAAQALKACAAFTGDAAKCQDLGEVCDNLADDGAPDTSVVCGNIVDASEDCACWAYAGDAVGYVYNPADDSCLCPWVGDPQWN